MPNIREQFSSKPSSTRLRGELKDARDNFEDRIATFEEPEPEAGIDADSKPNLLRRALPAVVVATGVTAVILAGGNAVGKGAKAIADEVWGVINGADTYGMLQHPYPDVNAEVKAGAIDSSAVTRVTVHHPASAWGEAKALAGSDHAAGPVEQIIEKQQGDVLASGDHLILQAGSIEPQPK
jgi:hypothetical protein